MLEEMLERYFFKVLSKGCWPNEYLISRNIRFVFDLYINNTTTKYKLKVLLKVSGTVLILDNHTKITFRGWRGHTVFIKGNTVWPRHPKT